MKIGKKKKLDITENPRIMRIKKKLREVLSEIINVFFFFTEIIGEKFLTEKKIKNGGYVENLQV